MIFDDRPTVVIRERRPSIYFSLEMVLLMLMFALVAGILIGKFIP